MSARDPDAIPDELAALRRSPVRAWIERVEGPARYLLVRTAILRLLGLVYFVAFASAIQQAPALVGERGLMPARAWLDFVAHAKGSRLAGFARLPSIFWIDASDGAITFACALGAALAVAVMAGVTNAGVMLALWILQLSLHAIGQTFWGYGWEIQLLETGLLAALLCPMKTWRPFASPPPLASIWLMRWLIVRVMLGAGLIKLRGDVCWRDLTCLVFHYETQPNPSPLSWWFHQMPRGAHMAGAVFNYLVELGAPLLLFSPWRPRDARRLAGGLFVLFQAVLIASGNLSFLNWLTVVPALACFDDATLERLVPARWRPKMAPDATASRAHLRVARAYAFVVALLSVPPVVNLLSSEQQMNASFEPLHLVNTYGAFGSVSRVRHEIVLEGTRDASVTDATRWEPYELPCKPGDPARRPCLVSPWHYRLDWQMWFAAMSSYEDEPWIAMLADKMLRGDRAIAPLFARDPFDGSPPRFVRAELYRYELTRRGEPGYWKRARVGEYMRPMSKDDPELDAFLRERGMK
ncbi:MAG: lipase maturation factor family protein [Labilithrix sp.]|nr:lipase maturation factor family protein [Labilithrix sp.]